MRTRVTDLWLYRWRYGIGYTTIIVAISLVIAIASIYVPGSLRQGEIDAAITTGNLSLNNLTPHMVVDLPYHALQRASFKLLGVTNLSIKLPSILLGIATAIGIFLLIRTWFRRNVAVLTTIVATTMTQFLFLVQDGTPAIMFSFLTIWILFAATYVTRKKLFSTFWKVLTGLLMATALYTPLGVYLVVAVLTTAFFHPHIRHIITHMAKPQLVVAILLGLATTTPLIYASIIDHSVIQALVGLPEATLHMKDNLRQVGLDIFGFAAVAESYMLRPVFSLGVVMLSLVGIYKLLTYKYTARSYITLTLGLLMVPLILLNPHHVTHLFPLAVLMVALGLATLITDWYKLFPRNPYARVGGLIPLGILVGGIVTSGVLRYMNNYEYNPDVLRHYSSDLRLVQDQLRYQRATKDTAQLVVSQKEKPLYDLVAHYDPRFFATTTPHESTPITIMTRSAYHAQRPAAEPTLIVTTRFSEQSDRLYLFKK